MSAFVRNAWYVAGWSHDLPARLTTRRLLGEPVVLYRKRDGALVALEDRCAHRGMPLSMGRVQGDALECGYHGVTYGCDGICVRIPGQETAPKTARVRAYPVVEQDGLAWIWMGDPALARPEDIVRWPYHLDRARWPHKATTFHLKCNYTLVVDNLLDLTHLAFVHRRTIGGNPVGEHVTAEMNVERKESGVRFLRWLLNSTPPPTYVAAVGFKGKVDRWMDFEFVAPSAVLQFTGALDAGTGAYDQGKREGGFALRIFHAITPETEHTTHYFWSSAHGYRQDEPQVTEQLFDDIAATFQEDVVILEAQYARIRELGDRSLFNMGSDVARVHAMRVIEKRLAAERGAVEAA